MTSELRGGLIRLKGGWQTAAEPSLAAPAPREAKPSYRVLLVEDNPGDARLVQLALGASRLPRFVVERAGTLAAAVERVGAGGEPFDVILLDLGLPDAFGAETLERMRAVAPDPALVIMTGSDDAEFAAQAIEGGAQDFLVKGEDSARAVVRAIRHAIARTNAQAEHRSLIEVLAAQRLRLSQELSAARRMQFDLLPRPEKVDPRLKGLGLEVESLFEPSSEIGGDLWGCLDGDGARCSFYTLDVSGHGIGAALNVFRLHALIADHWRSHHAPSYLLKQLGGALSGLLERGQFATMFLCTIDVARDQLEWASAGAPPPLMVHDGQCMFLESRGVPLGVQRAPEYLTHRVAFPPGSSLFVYSDAIPEAMVGEDRILGTAAVGDMVAELVRQDGDISVARLVGAVGSRVRMPLEDDLTLLRITRLAGRP